MSRDCWYFQIVWHQNHFKIQKPKRYWAPTLFQRPNQLQRKLHLYRSKQKKSERIKWSRTNSDMETENRRILLHKEKQKKKERKKRPNFYLIHLENLFSIDIHFKITRDIHSPNKETLRTQKTKRTKPTSNEESSWQLLLGK